MRALINSPSPRRQRGASFFSLLLMAALLALAITAGLKLAPAYMDNGVVVNAVEGALARGDAVQMSVGEIRSEVMRTLNVNNIRDFDSSSIQLVREGGREYVTVNYEKRVDLFYNIDALVSFENRIDR